MHTMVLLKTAMTVMLTRLAGPMMIFPSHGHHRQTHHHRRVDDHDDGGDDDGDGDGDEFETNYELQIYV